MVYMCNISTVTVTELVDIKYMTNCQNPVAIALSDTNKLISHKSEF